MGISNSTQNMHNRVARWKGERDEKQAAIEHIEAGITRLEALRERVRKLDSFIASAEEMIQEDVPGWSSEVVAPKHVTNRHSPVPYGELGRTALEVMRDAPPEGWPVWDITRIVLERFNLDPTDRALLDKKTNSLSAYLKANDGDLVESDNAAYYKRWRLIRPPMLMAVK